MNWNSERWGKKYILYWATRATKGRQKSHVLAQRAHRTNQERIHFICISWVPMHLSFNSQQGPPLSRLSGACISFLKKSVLSIRINWSDPETGFLFDGQKFYCWTCFKFFWSKYATRTLFIYSGIVRGEAFNLRGRRISVPIHAAMCNMEQLLIQDGDIRV